MASEEKIKQFIAELASRKNNVPISDIEWVMSQLESFGRVTRKQNDHQLLYTSTDGPSVWPHIAPVVNS